MEQKIDRRCKNADGSSKYQFHKRMYAVKWSRKRGGQDHDKKVYKCPKCDMYHLGH